MRTEQVAIAGWSCNGLRCPDYSVDFTRGDGNVHRVSLIQMPNGTGKTTTLGLLRAALSGRSPNGLEWDQYPIRDLAKAGSASGQFVLHILHDEKRWSFRLEFDFENAEIETFTTGPSGEEIGFNPPRSLEQFFNANFVRFFVFDGELATDLTNAKKQDAQRAIDALFRLSSFQRMGDWANDFLNDRITQQMESGSGTGSTDQGLERQRNTVFRLEQRIKSLEERKKEVEDQANETSARIAELESANRTAIAAKRERGERFETALNKEKEADVQSKALSNDLLAAMRDPHCISGTFAELMARLRTSFDRLKLPENTAREWFEELADEEKCVCGRPITEKERDYIRSQAEKYLGSSEVALLNQLKGEISAQITEPFQDSDVYVSQLIERVTTATDHLGRCQDEVQRIKEDAGQDDPEIEKTEKEIRELRSQLREHEEELRRFGLPERETRRPEDCYNIQELNRRHKRETKKLDEITQTATLRWKTETLDDLVGIIHAGSVRAVGVALADRVNEALENLMPDNNVRLKSIERSLVFSGKTGASVGETLTVGYAFLTHLADQSSYGLPLVIDTPAAPIDEHIRAEIGRSLPKLVKQFIAFTISPERGSFTQGLDSACDGDIQYLTLFRSSNERLMKSIEGTDASVDRTADACVVSGVDYFDRFQDDSEYHPSANPENDNSREGS